MKYIDFDGVIMDTTKALIREYYKGDNIPDKCFIDDDFIINYDWHKLIRECSVINNAIEIIKSFDYRDVAILTKVLTLDNEGMAKINFLREKGVKCNIILVPEHAKKIDVVNAKDSVLIDDSLHNLEEWEEQGGISIFFDLKGTKMDGWGDTNTKFISTDTLAILKKY